MSVNLKLTSALFVGGVMVMATSLLAITTNAPSSNSSTTSDLAGDNSNPYAVIVDRNIFRLVPIPPPPLPEEKKVELPKVYLSGIIKIRDSIQVLFSIPSKDAKSPGLSYYALAPGEKSSGQRDDLELVRVHPDQQGVDIIINGTPMSLSLADNNLASTAPSSAKGASGGRQAPVAVPGPQPAPVAAVTESSQASSPVIVGGNSQAPSASSSGGGITVGGGGVTVIGGGGGGVVSGGGGAVIGGGGGGSSTVIGGGGGNSTIIGSGGSSLSSSTGGVTVGGGGSSLLASSGGGITVSGGANGLVINNPNGGQSTAPAVTTPVNTEPTVSPAEQAAAMEAFIASHKNPPPMLPGMGTPH